MNLIIKKEILILFFIILISLNKPLVNNKEIKYFNPKHNKEKSNDMEISEVENKKFIPNIFIRMTFNKYDKKLNINIECDYYFNNRKFCFFHSEKKNHFLRQLEEHVILFFYDNTGKKVHYLNPSFPNKPYKVIDSFNNNNNVNLASSDCSLTLSSSETKSYNGHTVNRIKLIWDVQLSDLSGMFKDCSDLTIASLDNIQTITNMKYMFSGCYNLLYVGFYTYYCEEDTPVINRLINNNYFQTNQVVEMQYIFEGCRNLKQLNIFNILDSSNVENMEGMFYNSSITSFYLSKLKTTKVKNMKNMFAYSNLLETLNFENFDTRNLENMEKMFYNCQKIKSLDLSNFDTSKVTTMNQMFGYCIQLTSLKLSSNFETMNVKNMEGIFYECRELTSINLLLFDTKNVINMKEMFYDCNKLSSLDLSNFITSEVTDMSNMFYNCSNLISLDLINFDTSKVENMTSMFSGCRSLQSLDISNFDTSKVENMSSMFSECRSLQSLDISNFDTSNVLDNSFNDVFEGCSSLEYINLYDYKGKDIFISINNFSTLTVCSRDYTYQDNSLKENHVINICYTIIVRFINKNEENVKYMNPEFPNKPKYISKNNVKIEDISDNCEIALDNKDINEIKITWEKKLTDLSEIFRNCYNIYEIYIEKEKFDTSLVKEMKYMFYGCSDLIYLKFNVITTNLENIEGMFENCNKIRDVNLGDFSISNVKNMKKMFSGCISIRSLNLSHFNVESVENMEYMFSFCDSLEYIDLPKLNFPKLEKIEGMFLDCFSLISINLSNFEANILQNAKNMFRNCYSLKYIDLSDFYAESLTHINSIFSGCSSLEYIDLSKFNIPNIQDMNNMFYNCISLKSIEFLNFNPGNIINMNSTFSGCISLEYLNLSLINSPSLKHISSMFYNCKSLIALELPNFNANNIISFLSLFENCDSLRYLNLYNYQGGDLYESLQNKDNEFKYCMKTNEIKNSPDFSLYNYINICSDNCYDSSIIDSEIEKKCKISCLELPDNLFCNYDKKKLLIIIIL